MKIDRYLLLVILISLLINANWTRDVRLKYEMIPELLLNWSLFQIMPLDNLVKSSVMTAQVSAAVTWFSQRALSHTSSLSQSPLTTVDSEQPVAARTGPRRWVPVNITQPAENYGDRDTGQQSGVRSSPSSSSEQTSLRSGDSGHQASVTSSPPVKNSRWVATLDNWCLFNSFLEQTNK